MSDVFLEALYGDRPADSLIAISQKNGNGWGKSWFEPTIERAAAHVRGAVDVYVRISTVRERPRAGRGTEELSASIPGLWIEVDVNGCPDGRGGLIAGAFDTAEDGFALADTIVPLSMTVSSGYGGHGYVLFEQPLILASGDDRARAKELVQRYQAAVRARARAELGIVKVDSTHDLARVFRPPGSFNAKGDQPVPVELLTAGDATYAVDELDALLPAIEQPRKAKRTFAEAIGATTPISNADAAKIMLANATLKKIAERKGKAPGDGSGHAWDWYLACEAVRAGHSDEEIAGFVRCARAIHGEAKGQRDDYIEQTVAKARAEVGSVDQPPADDEERAALCAAIGKTYNLGDSDPIVGGRRVGHGGGAIVHLYRASGAELVLGYMDELFEPRAHTRNVSLVTRTRFKALTTNTAAEVAQMIIQLCDEDEMDELRERVAQWTGDFIRDAGAEIVVSKMDTPAGRWAALDEAKTKEHDDLRANRTAASRAAILIDEQQRAWIPAGAFRASLSPGAPGWDKLNSLMSEAGWERKPIDMHEPGVDRARARHLKGVFYVEPEVTS